jgi:hypothetical protein
MSESKEKHAAWFRLEDGMEAGVEFEGGPLKPEHIDELVGFLQLLKEDLQ